MTVTTGLLCAGSVAIGDSIQVICKSPSGTQLCRSLWARLFQDARMEAIPMTLGRWVSRCARYRESGGQACAQQQLSRLSASNTRRWPKVIERFPAGPDCRGCTRQLARPGADAELVQLLIPYTLPDWGVFRLCTAKPWAKWQCAGGAAGHA